MNTNAQIDVTGGKPDSNGIEEIECPFHDGDNVSAVLDFLRNAFMCPSCRAEGGFVIEIVNGKRIAVLTLLRYRPGRDGKEPDRDIVLPGRKHREMVSLETYADLSRESLKAAVKLMRPDTPIALVCGEASLADKAFRVWLREHADTARIVVLPDGLLKTRNAWALYGKHTVVVEVGR